MIITYLAHSMVGFILDLKNIQTINKQKTQDYYTIIQKLSDLNFVLIFHECFAILLQRD